MARAATSYDRLGVEPDAAVEDIHARFRSLARDVHPDLAVSPDELDERIALTKSLNEAWRTLSDPGRRAEYDASLPRDPLDALRRRGRRMRGRLDGRRWRPGLPHPSILVPGVADPRPSMARVGSAVRDTRLGQWLVLLAAASVPLFAPLDLAGLPVALAVAGVIAVLLARGGPPSPLWDGAAVFWRLSTLLGGSLARVGSVVGLAFLGLLAERVNEARTSDDDMARLTKKPDDPFDIGSYGGSYGGYRGGSRHGSAYDDPFRVPSRRRWR